MSRKTKWTHATALKEAKNFNTRTALKEGSRGAWNYIKTHGLRAKAYEHMSTPSKIWTKETALETASAYSSITKFKQEYEGAYKFLRRENLLEELREVLPSTKTEHTDSSLLTLVNTFDTLTDFATAEPSAYRTLRNRELIPSKLVSLFPEVIRKPGVYLLYKDSTIVYVGKSSTSISSRLLKHMKDITKEFTKAVAYVIPNEADLAVAEVYLINKYKPEYNTDSKSEHVLTLTIPDINLIIDETYTYTDLNNTREPYMT